MTLLFDSERSGHTLVPFVGGRQCDPLQRCVKNCPQGHTLRHTLRPSHTAEKCLHHAVSPQTAAPQHSSHTQGIQAAKRARRRSQIKPPHFPNTGWYMQVQHLEYSQFPWRRRSLLPPKLSYHEHHG